MSRRVLIFDTTLRDGEQSPGASMNRTEKLRMAKALAALGVDIIEAGFPIASPGDFEAVRTIARNVHGPTIAGLARCNRADIERASEAVREADRPRLHVFLATSANAYLNLVNRVLSDQVAAGPPPPGRRAGDRSSEVSGVR